MPATTDIKLAFEQYDMTPGNPGRRFRRNLLIHGTKSDEAGFSVADTLARSDEGAVDAAGNPAPGAPTIPAAANTANDKRRALRVTRVKNSFSFLVAHISDEPTKTLLAEPTFAFQARQLLRDMPTADGLDTNESTVGRTSGNRGARGHGGLSRSAIVLQRREESQNFLSFSFWKENDRIKSGLRPSSETDRQGVHGSWHDDTLDTSNRTREVFCYL